jgi:hypothetical protein
LTSGEFFLIFIEQFIVFLFAAHSMDVIIILESASDLQKSEAANLIGRLDLKIILRGHNFVNNIIIHPMVITILNRGVNEMNRAQVAFSNAQVVC